MSDYDVRRAELGEVRALRLGLLHPGGTLEDVTNPGDELPGALHVAGYRDDVPVAMGSIHPAPMPGAHRTGAWRLREVAVEYGHRGRGLASMVVERCIEHASNEGGRICWAIVPAGAFGFASRYGFRRHGDPIAGDAGPHYLAYTGLVPMDRSWSL